MVKIKAFSALELIVVMAILVVFVTSGAAIGIRSFNQQQITANRDLLITSLYQAQALARAGSNGSSWGVSLQSGNQLYVFSGTSFATRDISEDIVYNIAGGVSISGPAELVFDKVSGFPSSPSTFTVNNGADNFTVSLNSLGTINV